MQQDNLRQNNIKGNSISETFTTACSDGIMFVHPSHEGLMSVGNCVVFREWEVFISR